jgi:ribosomal protein L10
MSKYVKNLIADNLRNRLLGVDSAILVNVVGLKANLNTRLRSELRSKNIHVLVVKNSLARRAVADTALAPMFEDVSGSTAICWGADDIVSLAKEVRRLVDSKTFDPFVPRGGVMDGARLTADQVAEVSKWPSREEQLSILVGQILGPGGRIAGQLNGPGGSLVSQLKEKAKGGEEEEPAAAAAEGAAAEGAAQ